MDFRTRLAGAGIAQPVSGPVAAPITAGPVAQAPEQAMTAPIMPATPIAQAPVAQAPVAQAPVAQAPVAQAPVAQAPVAQAEPIAWMSAGQPAAPFDGGIPAPAAQTRAPGMPTATVTAPAPKERKESMSSVIRQNVLAGMDNNTAWQKAREHFGITDPNNKFGYGMANWHRADLRKKNLLAPELDHGTTRQRSGGGMKNAAKIRAWKSFHEVVAREDAALAVSIGEFIARKEAEVAPAPIPGAQYIGEQPAPTPATQA